MIVGPGNLGDTIRVNEELGGVFDAVRRGSSWMVPTTAVVKRPRRRRYTRSQAARIRRLTAELATCRAALRRSARNRGKYAGRYLRLRRKLRALVAGL